jgi:crotonobetainyl-CoA:carnitine CoA-transferase CaiB-like acyl-CoA transferase
MNLAAQALAQLWKEAGLPSAALSNVQLTGQDPVVPSSFAVGAAAQASIAAAALAANHIGALRGLPNSSVSVDMAHAATECLSHFAIDGVTPPMWDKFSGAYRCADGWVRIHANFAHHREGALALLGLGAAADTNKADVEKALLSWRAEDFETAASARGLVVAALRTHAQWVAHPQALVLAGQPLFAIESIASAPNEAWQAAHAQSRYARWLAINPQDASQNLPNFLPPKPLRGLRVLDLTRILAGPVCGRALAAYGADVLLINSPHLPNIDAIADTSRGKRSAHVDLRSSKGKAVLRQLIAKADIFVQGYRPGALEALGFGAQEVAAINPHIVYVSLSAYGDAGPWAPRRGFDSLVQTATGLNADESAAAGIDLASSAPRTLPMQILDHATGYLMAFAALAAMAKQREQGAGAVHVRLSLARTALWLRSLGRVANGFACQKPSTAPYEYTEPSGFGQLTALTHSAQFNGQNATWALPSMPPGTHAAQWW